MTFSRDARIIQYQQIKQCDTSHNKMKKSYNHLNQEKAFDKIQHLLIKILKKVSLEETYLNVISDIYDKPTANIILMVKT